MAIHKKLLEFSKKGITVEKDAKNPFHKSDYTTLNEVLDKVQGPLAEMNIVIVQRGATEGPTDGLLTELIDTEDESMVSSFFPFVGATDAQKLGANITYLRRYALTTLLGLRAKDDDGESAMPRKKATGVGDMTTNPFND